MKYLKMALLGAMLGNSVTHADNHSAIKLEKNEGDKISVKIKGEHFTTYHYGKDRAKPILYPVLGPKNKRMVRDWPIKKDSPNEAHDHPHHESLWYTHGDVNGISFWHVGDKMGKIHHKKFLKSSLQRNYFK